METKRKSHVCVPALTLPSHQARREQEKNTAAATTFSAIERIWRGEIVPDPDEVKRELTAAIRALQLADHAHQLLERQRARSPRSTEVIVDRLESVVARLECLAKRGY